MANVKEISFPYNDVLVSSLLGGYKWDLSGAETAQLTYSFPVGDSAVWPVFYPDEADSWIELNTVEQQQFVSALKQWESVANITFLEVNDSSSSIGEIRVAHSFEVYGATVAWAYLPSPAYLGRTEAAVVSGDIWLNNDDYSSELGSSSYFTLLHEIGHAIGLEHPHEGERIMPIKYDSTQYSVMSYTDHPDSLVNGQYPITPMLLDIAAIQYLYGANDGYNSGDTSYTFTTDGEILTIWDGGGFDTFDFSNQYSAVDVSLLAGTFSSVGYLNNAADFASNNITIAYDVVIEKVIGSRYSDVLTGNAADNIFVAGLGDDTIFGGDGGDVLVVSANYTDALITFIEQGVELVSSDGKDQLSSIEAIHFNDGYVSLLNSTLPEVIVDENLVGRILSLYQAALDREPDADGLNFWVKQYIDGLSILGVAQSFVGSNEFSEQFQVSSGRDYVNTLYQNVLGRLGEQEGSDFWLSSISAGESYAKILLAFSDSAENQVQVAPLIESLTYHATNDIWSLG